MTVHRLTKPEQHLPSFAPHRTFIRGKKKSATGKRWYFLMWGRCKVKMHGWCGFSQASGEIGTSRVRWWAPACPLGAESIRNPVWQFAVVTFPHCENLSSECCCWGGEHSAYRSVFNKHTLHWYRLLCRNAHLPPEMRNGEGRKIVFVYSTGGIKILGPLPLMRHLIPSSFFHFFPQC